MRRLPWTSAAMTAALVLHSLGCGQGDPGLGRIDGVWGPGVCDVEAARQKMLAAAESAGTGDWERVRTEIGATVRTMTWEQATFVYRTTEQGNLRKVLLCRIIESVKYAEDEQSRSKLPAGMSREAIIAILGKPDGDWGSSLVYTGENSASDSTSGFLFELDENRRLMYIGIGN